MENAPLLKPMAADALTRRPPQQASVAARSVALRERESDPAAFHLPVLAPRPEKASVPEKEPDLDTLLSTYVNETDDEDEPLEDAVPTERMPVPVCVPLYDQPQERQRSLWWILPILLLIAGATGYAAWKMGYVPQDFLQGLNISQLLGDWFV